MWEDLEDKKRLKDGLLDEMRIRLSSLKKGERLEKDAAGQVDQEIALGVLESILEYLPEGMIVVQGSDLKIKVISRYASKMIALPFKDLAGRTYQEISDKLRMFHEDGETEGKFEEIPLVRAVRQGELVTEERWVIQRSDGSKVPILCNAGPILDDKGQTTGGVLSFVDMVDVKLFEKKLGESEEWLKRIFSSNPDSLLLIDFEDGHILEVNKAFIRITGFSRDEVIGKTVTESGLWEDTQEMARLIELLEKEGRYENAEIRIKTKQGTTIRALVSAEIVQAEGKRYIIAGGQDITALHEAREEANRANRSKSEFLANMSHEIRTPLNGVLGMTELALMNCTEPDAKRYLHLVKQSGRALLGIINDILDLAKIEAGKAELEFKPFLLRPLIDSITKPLGIMAENKGLTLRHSVDVETPDKLVGDAGRLRQVITNIIGNAIKFTEAGKVTVTVTLADEPASSTDRARLLFQVRDTGIGIPQDRLEHVFESFAQVDGSAHVQYGGTGLGLTISRELIEKMGGHISVESEVGKGSLFSFTAEFGLAEGVRAEMPEEVRMSQRLQPMEILLVEDNIINQTLAAELLKHGGHTVTTVSNGKEALEKLKSARYDLVLMDVRMPDMDGEEATRRIREGETLDSQVPIVALTAHALKGDRERFLAAGMDDYLPKPIDTEGLNQVLARVMAKRNKDAPLS